MLNLYCVFVIGWLTFPGTYVSHNNVAMSLNLKGPSASVVYLFNAISLTQHYTEKWQQLQRQLINSVSDTQVILGCGAEVINIDNVKI